MSKFKTDSNSISRRTLLAAASVAPCSRSVEAAAPAGVLIAQCATWLALDIEIDRLATRWAELEVVALDYELSESMDSDPVLSAEMDAISAQLDVMGVDRNQRLKVIAATTPANLHEVTSQLAVAARTLLYEDSWAEPLVKLAIVHLSTAACPGCGRPHAPAAPTLA